MKAIIVLAALVLAAPANATITPPAIEPGTSNIVEAQHRRVIRWRYVRPRARRATRPRVIRRQPVRRMVRRPARQIAPRHRFVPRRHIMRPRRAQPRRFVRHRRSLPRRASRPARVYHRRRMMAPPNRYLHRRRAHERRDRAITARPGVNIHDQRRQAYERIRRRNAASTSRQRQARPSTPARSAYDPQRMIDYNRQAIQAQQERAAAAIPRPSTTTNTNARPSGQSVYDARAAATARALAARPSVQSVPQPVPAVRPSTAGTTATNPGTAQRAPLPDIQGIWSRTAQNPEVNRIGGEAIVGTAEGCIQGRSALGCIKGGAGSALGNVWDKIGEVQERLSTPLTLPVD